MYVQIKVKSDADMAPKKVVLARWILKMQRIRATARSRKDAGIAFESNRWAEHRIA
jgi:hypothetical protein